MFGEAGTLTIARIITEILSQLTVKKCGYSGLMLPVLEDHGLAKRNIEESLRIDPNNASALSLKRKLSRFSKVNFTCLRC